MTRRRKIKKPKLPKCQWTGKIRWPTEEEAKLRLDLIKFHSLPWRKEASYYYCQRCGGYHMTSLEQVT